MFPPTVPFQICLFCPNYSREQFPCNFVHISKQTIFSPLCNRLTDLIIQLKLLFSNFHLTFYTYSTMANCVYCLFQICLLLSIQSTIPRFFISCRHLMGFTALSSAGPTLFFLGVLCLSFHSQCSSLLPLDCGVSQGSVQGFAGKSGIFSSCIKVTVFLQIITIKPKFFVINFIDTVTV